MQSANLQAIAGKDMPTLEINSQGRAVAYLQYLLISYGIDLGSSDVDGIYGNDTKQGVINFQTEHNQISNLNPPLLKVDGIVGHDTWRALGDNFYRTCGTPEGNGSAAFPNSITANDLPLLRQGDSGEAVRLLQQMLLGYSEITQFPGSGSDDSFDGQFGPITENSVKAFQSYAGLNQDGEVGKNTWRELFKGSRDRCQGNVA